MEDYDYKILCRWRMIRMARLPMLLGLLNLLIANSKLVISRSIAYRFDFLVSVVLSIGFSGIGPLVQYLIYSKTQGYPGWSITQMILFQGMVLISLGLRDFLFGNVRNIVMDLVRKGDFDRLLLKPYPPIGVLLTSGFNSNGIGTVLAGIAVTWYSIVQLHLNIGIVQILLFAAVMISGLLMYMAMIVLFSCIVIMIIQMGRIGELLDVLLRFADYRLQILPQMMRITFVTLIPFAIFNYYPAQLLLGRADNLVFVAMAGTLFFFWIMLKWWGVCLKKYTSAGG
jgi:ABC-2 type transport system permease protein